ncbi:MAG: ATP/GTP-binding protein [Pseudomonadota bacterium]
MHLMRLFTALLPTFLAATSAPAEEVWSAGPFDMPESALVDAARDRIVVSVIGGHPGAADGNGRLALVSRDGALIDPAWVTGLDAPKGMAVVAETLLVADLTRLHQIDLATGQLLRSLNAPGALFLNDLTSDGETAYVSDLMTGKIWRYAEGALDVWLEAGVIDHPNGLLLDGDRLLVGGWGKGLRDDFATETPGSLHAVSLEGRTVATLAVELGNLDGLARAGAALFVSDWVAGTLMALDENGALIARHSLAPGIADIAADGDRLLLPMMLDGQLNAMTIE